jgi:hypothetical protein
MLVNIPINLLEKLIKIIKIYPEIREIYLNF